MEDDHLELEPFGRRVGILKGRVVDRDQEVDVLIRHTYPDDPPTEINSYLARLDYSRYRDGTSITHIVISWAGGWEYDGGYITHWWDLPKGE